MSELVEDLELWLDEPAYVDTGKRGREIERASWLIQRARDEIVGLRGLLEHSDRTVVTAIAVATPAIRDEALEEAASEAETIIGRGWSPGACRACAAAIRALKDKG